MDGRRTLPENWKSVTSKERKGGFKEESWAIKEIIETGISLLLRLARGGLWSLYIRWWLLATRGGNAILGKSAHNSRLRWMRGALRRPVSLAFHSLSHKQLDINRDADRDNFIDAAYEYK